MALLLLKKYLISVLLLVRYCLAINNNYERYNGHKVYLINTTPQKAFLLQHNVEELDFWNHIQRVDPRPLKVMVKPEFESKLIEYLEKHQIDHQLYIRNVSDILRKQHLDQFFTSKHSKRQLKSSIAFDYYLSYDEMISYLKGLEIKYSNFFKLIHIGMSFEGNDIFVANIRRLGNWNKHQGKSKPAILIDAGIHAREWIAPATALYIINQLVENKENVDLTENVDWYIIPCLNPDGYEYSHKTDRLWRKTRSRRFNSKCTGVDGNRNFDYLWGKAGSSDNPCHNDYKGPHPFSEEELQSFRNFTDSIKRNIKLYLSLHSYGRFILYPYGAENILPENEEELENLAQDVGNQMLKISGKRWKSGNSAKVLYATSGTSDDWMMQVNEVDLCYVLELQGDDKYEFQLPSSKILESVKETFEGIRVFHSYVEEKYSFFFH